MSTGLETYLPLLLAAGAILSLVLLLVKVRSQFGHHKWRAKQPVNFVANPVSTTFLLNHISSNGHNHSPYSPAPGIVQNSGNLTRNYFAQIKHASTDEQFRLLSVLSPEQRAEFVNGLSYHQQGELWALLPLEIWAEWLSTNASMPPCEQEQIRKILGFCNNSFRAWAERWNALDSIEQSRFWMELDLAQQESLWKRLAALRLLLQRQKENRHRRLTYVSRLIPTAKVRIWLTLTPDEQHQLWEELSPSHWLELWQSLDNANRTRLWEGMNASQRRRMRHSLQESYDRR